ncbi:MAG: NADH-ubiquinone oxidoreductase-F iron-sulfur binding region domain-containing protein [Candidatus Woesearchaeota archaeon]
MQILTKTNFASFETALKKRPEEIIKIVKGSGLSGRGGANFPTGLKWELTRKQRGERILICNADEGEPGTFKDKFILDNNPELLIEGITIAAYAMGTKQAYLYLRGEYAYLKKELERIIEGYKPQLKKINLKIDIFLGAGAYICGDETAIMNSIEGKRGEPRAKPPYPAEKGLFGLPTCINNVETLANVPLIIHGDWKNLQLFSLSGNVSAPGVYEFPFCVQAEELLGKDHPKALFFGCAGGCVPYSPKLRLDCQTITSKEAMLGSGAIIAVGKNGSIPKVCRNIAEFFVHESCGYCSPCREGNYRILEILNKFVKKKAKKEDLEMLKDLAGLVKKTSFCGLGQSSTNHLLTALKYFPEEFRCK